MSRLAIDLGLEFSPDIFFHYRENDSCNWETYILSDQLHIFSKLVQAYHRRSCHVSVYLCHPQAHHSDSLPRRMLPSLSQLRLTRPLMSFRAPAISSTTMTMRHHAMSSTTHSRSSRQIAQRLGIRLSWCRRSCLTPQISANSSRAPCRWLHLFKAHAKHACCPNE